MVVPPVDEGDGHRGVPQRPRGSQAPEAAADDDDPRGPFASAHRTFHAPILPAVDEEALEEAAAVLAAGGLVVVPTDTVYGLAARVDRPSGVAAIFEAKRRPAGLALPVLAAGAPAAARLGDLGSLGEPLASRWWPGALTIVAQRLPGFTVDLGGDPATVGLRVPDHAALRALLARTGPLATTSANRSGQPTPGTVHGVASELGAAVALYLDGGPAPSGAPSTVVSVLEGVVRVLREGAIPATELGVAR